MPSPGLSCRSPVVKYIILCGQSSVPLGMFVGSTLVAITFMGGVYAILPAYEADLFGECQLLYLRVHVRLEKGRTYLLVEYSIPQIEHCEYSAHKKYERAAVGSGGPTQRCTLPNATTSKRLHKICLLITRRLSPRLAQAPSTWDRSTGEYFWPRRRQRWPVRPFFLA